MNNTWYQFLLDKANKTKIKNNKIKDCTIDCLYKTVFDKFDSSLITMYCTESGTGRCNRTNRFMMIRIQNNNF